MSSRRHDEDWQAIGIDLGTSYSCVGIWRNGHVDIIPNDQGSRKTPSCVAFTDTQRLIGEAAVNQGRTNSSNTIYDVKRLIGRRFTDEVVQRDLKSWPFKVINGYDNGKDDKPLMVVTYMGNLKTFRAEEISAMVLMKLKDAAEAFLGKSVKNVVLTVPAYFNDSQRQATKDAGVIAGLNVLHLLNEPTAAALAYDFDKKIMSSNDKLLRRNNVLVFDLGGGSFDVSLVCIENGKIEVKSVNGDTHLGGSDFDNRMVNYFVEEFKAKYKKDASQYPRALERLRLACEKAKRALSLIPQTSIEIDYFCDGIDFSSTISRACFENLNDDLFKRCISLVDQCLYNAQISKQNVDEVILVGGSTRIPKVQQLLQEFFNGKELSKSINPDEAVAYGAALYGGFFSGITDNKNRAPVDVTPLSIYVKEISGTNSYTIPRNTTIPTRHKPVFGNENNGRRGFSKYIKKCFKFVFALCRRFLAHIKNCFKSVCRCKKRKRQCINGSKFMVYEGERHETEGNNLLGSFDLSSFNPPSNFEIDIDTNGILSVLAKDSRTCNMSEVSIMDRSTLTMQDVVTMTSNAKEYKAQDKKHEETVKAKNTLEDYANAMSEKLSNSSQKPKDKNIRDEIEHVLKWLEWNSAEVRDAADYMTKLHELESICRPIQGDS